MKPSIRFLAVVIVFAGKSREAEGPPPPAVTVSKAVQKEVIERDEYTGRLAAVDEVEIRAQISGYRASMRRFR